jgi:hypothetical protein
MPGPGAPETWPEAGTDPAGGTGAGAGAAVSTHACAPGLCMEVGTDPEVDSVTGAAMSGQTGTDVNLDAVTAGAPEEAATTSLLPDACAEGDRYCLPGGTHGGARGIGSHR